MKCHIFKSIAVVVAALSTCISLVSSAQASEIVDNEPSVVESNVSDVNIDNYAKRLEIIFSRYLKFNEINKKWTITQAGEFSHVPKEVLENLIHKLNANASVDKISSNDNHAVRSKDYAKCIINATGLGSLAGVFTGAFTKLLEKQLWKQAAMYILKVAGSAAFRGGAVGLAASLAASAIWCATPWSE